MTRDEEDMSDISIEELTKNLKKSQENFRRFVIEEDPFQYYFDGHKKKKWWEFWK